MTDLCKEDVLTHYEALAANLVPIMTRRILLLSCADVLFSLIKAKYPRSIVERLCDIGLDRLLEDHDVREIEHYDWIIADENTLRGENAGQLIQAAGLHLAPYGRLRCIAIGRKEVLAFDAILHANGFTATGLGEDSEIIDADKVYILCAGGFFGELVYLQQFYTEDVRRKMGFLVSRIDFDIDAEESAARLLDFCQKQDVRLGYLRMFAESCAINKEKVMAMLGM